MPVDKYEVRIEASCYALMHHWAKSSPKEVGGLYAVRLDGNVITLHSPFLIKQRVAEDSLHVSYDQEALLDWFDKQGMLDEALPFAHWGPWHSHGPAGVGFSAEDDEFLADYATRGLMVSTIINHTGDLTTKAVTAAGGLTIEECAIVEVFKGKPVISAALTPAMEAEADKAFAECVEFYKKNQPTTGFTNQGWRSQGVSYGNAYGAQDTYDYRKYWAGYYERQAELDQQRAKAKNWGHNKREKTQEWPIIKGKGVVIRHENGDISFKTASMSARRLKPSEFTDTWCRELLSKEDYQACVRNN